MNVLKSLSALFLPFVFIISVSARAELCFFGYQANSVSLVNEIYADEIHTQFGWVQNCTPEYVKPLTILSYRWRDWALSGPDVIGILGFT